MSLKLLAVLAAQLLAAAAPRAEASDFAFAVLTDLHIGRGVPDFGSPGYDDAPGPWRDDLASVRNSLQAVDKINALRGEHAIELAFALGDLTDSGERSEFAGARRVLDAIAVPYVPLIGNHDVWPSGGRQTAKTALGDRYFEEAFSETFDSLRARFPDLTKPSGDVWDPERGAATRFQNLAFSHKGYGFICLDWNSRRHAMFPFPGIDPGANLFDFNGGTYRWLAQLVRSGWLDDKKKVFVLQHHPIRTLTPNFGFSNGEKRKLGAILAREEFWGVLAGHEHRSYVGTAFDHLDRVVRPFARLAFGPAWDRLLALASEAGALAQAAAAGPQAPVFQVLTRASMTRAAVTVVRIAESGEISISQH
ncbi:MAG: metallophosphoesterase [Elusimicrobia bacterium]|nr:metallophosphoesterase [Elusimicrobiota bacterium]